MNETISTSNGNSVSPSQGLSAVCDNFLIEIGVTKGSAIAIKEYKWHSAQRRYDAYKLSAEAAKAGNLGLLRQQTLILDQAREQLIADLLQPLQVRPRKLKFWQQIEGALPAGPDYPLWIEGERNVYRWRYVKLSKTEVKLSPKALSVVAELKRFPACVVSELFVLVPRRPWYRQLVASLVGRWFSVEDTPMLVAQTKTEFLCVGPL